MNQQSWGNQWDDSHSYSLSVERAPAAIRAQFLGRVYTHLFMTVAGCAALTTIFMGVPAIRDPILGMFTFRFGALILMLGFMGVNWLAAGWAYGGTSREIQYCGLGLSAIAHAVLFTALLTFAEIRAPGISLAAGVLTLTIFATLTAVVWFTRWNFNFLYPVIAAGSVAVLAVIIFSFFFPIQLGIWFTAAMLFLAACYILYDTSRILREYPEQAYVAASLELFTGVAMLFWYVVRLLMQLKSND